MVAGVVKLDVPKYDGQGVPALVHWFFRKMGWVQLAGSVTNTWMAALVAGALASKVETQYESVRELDALNLWTTFEPLLLWAHFMVVMTINEIQEMLTRLNQKLGKSAANFQIAAQC
jgi:hypothetical protein